MTETTLTGAALCSLALVALASCNTIPDTTITIEGHAVAFYDAATCEDPHEAADVVGNRTLVVRDLERDELGTTVTGDGRLSRAPAGSGRPCTANAAYLIDVPIRDHFRFSLDGVAGEQRVTHAKLEENDLRCDIVIALEPARVVQPQTPPCG